MNTSCISVRRFFLIAALPFLFLANLSHAQDGEVRVPFLFSEDEKLDQTQLEQAIPKSRELQGDRYLNDPMTRMEYMLFRIEAALNTELQKGAIREQLRSEERRVGKEWRIGR